MTTADRLALAWFLVTWLGFGRLVGSAPSWMPSINGRMDDIRRAWMRAMLGRDNRITDASLIGHTVHSATFFASTTMVAIAGLLGVMGGFDRSFAGLLSLDFTAKTSRTLAEGKLLLLLLVFAHTFLKLSWAVRQLNYCLALIGASPLKPGAAERERIARPVACVLSLAVRSFNAGVRGYLFALAALAWLLGPMPFAAATAGIVAVLLWRQFGSATARSIAESHAALLGPSASNPAAELMGAGAAPAGAQA
jgi:uncharacterized membrane protein